MNRLRQLLPGLALAVIAVVSLGATPARAAAQMSRPPFGEGTHAFRRLLYDLKMEPLTGVEPLRSEPRHTLLVVLGETDVLDQLGRRHATDILPQVGGLQDFLNRGGAALVATDRAIPAHRLWNDFGVTVTGTQVQLQDGNRPGSRQYRDINECPLLEPVEGAAPRLFGMTGVPGAADLALRNVATNRPSFLELPNRLPAGLKVLANLPEGCWPQLIRGFRPIRPALPFAVGGTVGPGRLLVLADHSLFINDMMLQDDTDNIAFTYNCLDWLTAGKAEGTRVLFVEEGDIQTAFDIPLKETPLPLPPLNALVPLADDAIQQMEQQNAFNEVLLNLMPFDQFWVGLVVLLSALLAIYGLYRLVRARHRIEAAAPLLERVLAGSPAARSLMEQRHLALLGRGNLWEPARALARECFAAAGVTAADIRPTPPRLRVAGGWWRRRALGRLVRRLWHLAYGSRPVPVSPQEFARLPREVAEVRAALASGVLQLGSTDGVRVAPPSVDRLKAEGTVA
jgi:hypothetical protein